MPKASEQPPLKVEVRVSEHPISEAERSRRLRRLGQRLEAIRRRRAEESLRGRHLPDGA